MLIDAGLGPRVLAARLMPLGLSPRDLTDVLLTHEHVDHVRGLAALVKRQPELVIHCSRGTRTGLDRELRPRVRTLSPGRPFCLGEVQVNAFRVAHDARQPVGFRLDTAAGSLGYVTDLGVFDEILVKTLTGVDALIIESNHCPEKLAKGPYPVNLKRRVAGPRGHLSNVQCHALLKALLHTGIRYVAFAHLSGVNNSPQEVARTHAPLLADLPPEAWAVGRRDGPLSPVSINGGGCVWSGGQVEMPF